MKEIKYFLLLAVVFVLLPVSACFAADLVTYEIQWEYSVTNISDQDINQMPFTILTAPYAVDSPYQPETFVSQHMTTTSLEPSSGLDTIKHYKTNLLAGETQDITFTWTLKSGDFDQRLFLASQETVPPVKPFKGNKELIELTRKIISGHKSNRDKALAIYTWITQNIKYGEIQNYAEPEKATCMTFTRIFDGMCSIAGIPCRQVYGYTISFVDKYGQPTYGTFDISDKSMHAWNEFYDEIYGWVMVDATFDEGKSQFNYFMQGYRDKPHLAMFYDKLPNVYGSSLYNHPKQTEWSKKRTIKRFLYKDTNTPEENSLIEYQRIETENNMLEQLFKEQKVPLKVSRLTDTFSIDKDTLKIPAEYNVTVSDAGFVEVSHDEKQIILMQFKENGS